MQATPPELPRTLAEQVDLLGATLGRAIREHAGAATLERVEELRLLCKEAANAGRPELREQAAEIIAGLPLPEIVWLLRSFTAFFHLANQAERQEIVRVNRARTRDRDHPRPDSLDQAVGRLKAEGRTADQTIAVLRSLDIQPTLTAHPTEARRRSILQKQRRIASLLAAAERTDPTPDEVDAIRDGLAR